MEPKRKAAPPKNNSSKFGYCREVWLNVCAESAWFSRRHLQTTMNFKRCRHPTIQTQQEKTWEANRKQFQSFPTLLIGQSLSFKPYSKYSTMWKKCHKNWCYWK